MSFDSEFSAGLDKAYADAKTARNTMVLALGSKIIDDTPVLSGALKGSWRSSQDTPDKNPTARIDPSGEIPKAELAQVVKQWPDKGSVWMSNNLRYSEGVEFDSYSTQRPGGMVRVNLAGRADFADLTTGTGRTE